MKTLSALSKEIKSHEGDILVWKTQIRELESTKAHCSMNIEATEQLLYEKNILLCHIQEIFRMARVQFSRLRQAPEQALTDVDVKELDKWIGRTQSVDGLIGIWKAIAELKKYRPSDIKLNLYALVQKIIIEGPYTGKKRGKNGG